MRPRRRDSLHHPTRVWCPRDSYTQNAHHDSFMYLFCIVSLYFLHIFTSVMYFGFSCPVNGDMCNFWMLAAVTKSLIVKIITLLLWEECTKILTPHSISSRYFLLSF